MQESPRVARRSGQKVIPKAPKALADDVSARQWTPARPKSNFSSGNTVRLLQSRNLGFFDCVQKTRKHDGYKVVARKSRFANRSEHPLMKKTLTKIVIAVLMAGFLASTAMQVNAQEKKAAASSTKSSTDRKLPFHGKIASVDKAAKTFVIGTLTFQVTGESEITKNGKKATLDDANTGELAGGSYKDVGGTLEVQKMRIGPKPEGEAKAGENAAKPESKGKKKKQ
jgi:hypothetical protein